MDILFGNSIDLSFVDSDDQFQINTAQQEYEGVTNPAADLQHTVVNVEIASVVESYALQEDSVKTQYNISRHSKNVSHAMKWRERWQLYEHSIAAGSLTADGAAAMTRHSGTVCTHCLSSDDELVMSEGGDNRDCCDKQETQNQEVATDESRMRSRRVSVICPLFGLARAPDTADLCGGEPSVGSDGCHLGVAPSGYGAGPQMDAVQKPSTCTIFARTAPALPQEITTHQSAGANMGATTT